jgi:hypothetical protein
MKIAFTLIAGLFFSCTTEKEVQANLIDASLVKIDVISRYPNLQRKMLTWKTADNVTYITYVPMYSKFDIGATRKVLVRK